MSNDSNNTTGTPDDEVLTLEEQALFDSVFGEEAQAGADRWNLTDDWVEQLFGNIEKDGSTSRIRPTALTSTVVDTLDLVDVVDLSEERDAVDHRYLPSLRARSSPSLAWAPLWYLLGSERRKTSPSFR